MDRAFACLCFFSISPSILIASVIFDTPVVPVVGQVDLAAPNHAVAPHPSPTDFDRRRCRTLVIRSMMPGSPSSVLNLIGMIFPPIRSHSAPSHNFCTGSRTFTPSIIAARAERYGMDGVLFLGVNRRVPAVLEYNAVLRYPFLNRYRSPSILAQPDRFTSGVKKDY